MSEIKESYYKQKLPALIEKLKVYESQLLDIIEKDISQELSDDKLHNVLKAKKMATDDYIETIKKIESLEDVVNGTEKTKEELEEEEINGLHPSKKYAKQQK